MLPNNASTNTKQKNQVFEYSQLYFGLSSISVLEKTFVLCSEKKIILDSRIPGTCSPSQADLIIYTNQSILNLSFLKILIISCFISYEVIRTNVFRKACQICQLDF